MFEFGVTMKEVPADILREATPRRRLWSSGLGMLLFVLPSAKGLLHKRSTVFRRLSLTSVILNSEMNNRISSAGASSAQCARQRATAG